MSSRLFVKCQKKKKSPKSLFRSQRVTMWSGEPTEEIKNCTLTSCQHIRCRPTAEINRSLSFGHHTESVCSILPLQGSKTFFHHDRSLSQWSVTQFSMEMSGLTVSLVSFCEFGECEMISEVQLNLRVWKQWAKTKWCRPLWRWWSERDREWLKDWAAFCAIGTQASRSQLCLLAPPNTKQTPEAGGESLKPCQARNSHRSRSF